jgi:Zn-dependent protease
LFSFDFTELILTVTAVLITLTFHEFAHGYTAYKLGDPTAKSLGRLSLNPLRHLDPLGTLCMIFFRFGWAKPVPINSRYFKKPKRDFALCALAGPLTNILLSFFSAFLYLFFASIFVPSEIPFIYNVQYNVLSFLWIFHAVNLGLGIFNLIPIPPFDGSRIINLFLSPRAYFKVMRYEKQIYWVVIAWLFLGNYVYLGLVSIPFIGNSNILSGIASVFSLSLHLSNAIQFLSEAMLKFWRLIPFFR